MLLTNRRHRLIYMALGGMEVAWFLPFVILLVDRLGRAGLLGSSSLVWLYERSPLLLFILLWATLLFYMFFADMLDQRQVDSPQRELAMLSLLLATSLVGIRVLLYSAAPLDDLGWLARSFSAVFDFTEALRPELVVILVNFFLWFRVSVASDRDLSFFSVGVSFRLGMLLALLGNGLLTTLGRQPAWLGILYFSIFFAFGLIATALARIDDKAMSTADSAGSVLPWPRFVLISGAGLLILGAALLLARLLSIGLIRTVIGWTSPFWLGVGWVLGQISLLVFLLISPLIEWLIELLRESANEAPEMELGPMELGEPMDYASLVREYAAFRYCLVTLVIVAAIALLWLLFTRTRRQKRVDEAEEIEQGEIDYGAGALAAGWQRLRDWLRLVGRYGVGSRLLDAITVQNIYANIGRMARQRGFGRHPAQSPDDYLPELEKAFPAHEAELQEITAAYMRVHYGDQPIDDAGLTRVRSAYDRLLADPSDESST